MVSPRIAAEQLNRLRRFQGFPKADNAEDKALRRELLRALNDCRNADHCETVIDEAIRTLHFSPMPADLYELIAGTAERHDKPSSAECDLCCNGWQLTDAGAVRCSCVPAAPREAKPERKAELSRVDGKALAGKADW